MNTRLVTQRLFCASLLGYTSWPEYCFYYIFLKLSYFKAKFRTCFKQTGNEVSLR